MSLKQRYLALFQFISFLAAVIFGAGAVILGYSTLKGSTIEDFWSIKKWATAFGEALVFSNVTTNGVLDGMLFYMSMILFIISWVLGWSIIKIKDRNLYDSLFLLFLMIPILSNIFALFSQMQTKKMLFTDGKIDKKRIIKDQTRTIELELKNAKKAEFIKHEKILDNSVLKARVLPKIKEDKAIMASSKKGASRKVGDSDKSVTMGKQTAETKSIVPKKPVASKTKSRKGTSAESKK